MKRLTKTLSIILTAVVSITLLSACGSKESGIKIGVSTGTTYGEKAKEYSKITEIKTYKDDNLSLQELVNGRIDGVITDKLVGLYGIKQANYSSLKLVGDLIYTETIAAAVRQDDDSLRQAINAAIAEIISEGTYGKLSNKYFGKNILDGIDYKKTFPNDEPATDASLARVKKAGKITFALSGGYPPFNYFTENDELTGFDVEIGKAIAGKLGVKYEPVTADFSGLLEGLRSGRYDGILGSMAVTPERSKAIDFTDPYYYSGAQLIVDKDSEIKSIDELK